MNFSALQALDRGTGPLLCALARAGLVLHPPGPVKRPPERILVVKFWGMGGLLLTAPVFVALRRAFPRARLSLATLASNREAATWLGLADDYIFLDLAGTASAPFRVLRFFRDLRHQRADAVLDFEYLTRFSALASAVSRAPVRLGFEHPRVYRGGIHNRPFVYRNDRHVTENFLELARALDPAIAPVPEFLRPAAEAERRQADALLKGRGLAPERPLVVVNPNAGELALERRWPADYFIQLLDRLARENIAAALIGAPDEASYVAALQSRLAAPEAALNLAGQLSFAELVGILSRARLLVTNDSGPLHLAALLETPTVSFFGPESPLGYAPRGPQHTALYAGLDCSPCIRVETAKTVRCVHPRPECMFALSPDRAWEAVAAALAER